MATGNFTLIVSAHPDWITGDVRPARWRPYVTLRRELVGRIGNPHGQLWLSDEPLTRSQAEYLARVALAKLATYITAAGLQEIRQ